MAITTLLYLSTVQTNYGETRQFAFLLCCANYCFLYSAGKHNIEKQESKTPVTDIFSFDDFLCPSLESSI